jgi:Cu2+-exporting ATPase
VGCCTGIALTAADQVGLARLEELKAAARPGEDGRPRLTLSVPAIRCGQCIATIERALHKLPEVASARVNLTTRRVAVTLAAKDGDPVPVIEALDALGYPAIPVEPGAPAPPASASRQRLLRAMAVAGFGASNVMLMSVAVWSGAEPGLRDVFHLISAAIALPVVAYAGQPFFASAAAGLRAGRVNMDVPISLGVLLTLGLSLFEGASGGDHVFFDAALTLLFFLLVGRYFDALVRERASSAVTGLARLAARGGTVIESDGNRRYLPLDRIVSGMILVILPGDRVPVDVRIRRGGTDVDRSIVTGESDPAPAGPGDPLEAGSLNLTGAVEVEVLRPAGESFLAEVTRMLEAAEHGRGRYVRLADRVAKLYAPIVHLLAAATFAGWLSFTGGDWRVAIFTAVSVLIITCPCALGLHPWIQSKMC